MKHDDDGIDTSARNAGAVRLAAVMVALAVALWPVTVQVLGTDVGCGPAALAFGRSLAAHVGLEKTGQAVPILTQACGSSAWPRLLVAAVLGIGGLAVGWRLAPTRDRGKSFRLTRS